jgi:hypothetical protein
VILAWEQWLAFEHLGKDAAGAPDVHLDVVLLPCEHDLRRPIVSRRDVAGHLGILYARQAEVTDLEVAILVYEDVGGLEVAVHDAGGVDIFESALWLLGGRSGVGVGSGAHQDLVEKVLDELLLQRS